MSNRKFQVSLCALAASMVLVAGSTHAGVWSSNYDPTAFIGTALFDVPTPCLAGVADGQYLPTAFPGCAPIRVISNISTSPAIDFSSILPSSAVMSYDVINQQFVGVNTAVIGFVTVSETNYWFQFLSTFFSGDGPSSPPRVTNTVNLYNDCPFEGPTTANCGAPANVATIVSFARVPEPGSLALILGALGAGWLARRRKIAA